MLYGVRYLAPVLCAAPALHNALLKQKEVMPSVYEVLVLVLGAAVRHVQCFLMVGNVGAGIGQ